MTSDEETCWKYILKNKQATVEDIVQNCNVSLGFAEGLLARIASPNWRFPVEALKIKGGVKHDDGKLRYDLIPPEIEEAIAEVLTFGAAKYGPRDWELGMAWGRPYAALRRHLAAWMGGEDKDPETGLSHLAHAACCIAFLVTYEARGIGLDDRPKS